MANLIRSILRKATRQDDRLNILTFSTHERTQITMCKTGHTFYSFWTEGLKKWNSDYGAIPSNYIKMPNDEIFDFVDFDLVLSQSKAGQFQVGQKLAKHFNIPLISMEHTLPMPGWTPQHIAAIRKLSGNIDVFVTEYNRKAWGYPENHGEITYTGIDTELFKPLGLERNGTVLSICNDWINRDIFCGFSIWSSIVDHPNYKYFPVKILGDTKGLSESAKSMDELVRAYNECSVFLNTTTVSSLPTVILEAMSCELPIVTTSTCYIPQFIENGVNGFISNDINKLREYVQILLTDKELANKIGKAGRQTVLERFNESRYINKWNEIFNKALNL